VCRDPVPPMTLAFALLAGPTPLPLVAMALTPRPLA
jgi:hypothetical protein